MRRAVKNIPFTIGLANPSRRGGLGRLLALSFVLLFASCQPKVEHGGKHPVAQVYDNFLYEEDLVKLLPYGVSGADSVKLVRELTRKWVEEQVLYEKAEHNVRGDGRIEQLVADYRRQLILNDYEQRLIMQKMSEEVSEEDYLILGMVGCCENGDIMLTHNFFKKSISLNSGFLLQAISAFLCE